MRNKSINTFTDVGLDRWIHKVEKLVQNSEHRVFEVKMQGLATVKVGRVYTFTNKVCQDRIKAIVTYKHDDKCFVDIVAIIGKTRYHYFAEQPYRNLSKRVRKIRKLANYIIRYSKRIKK